MIAIPAAAAVSVVFCGFTATIILFWAVLILMSTTDRQRCTSPVLPMSAWDTGDGTVVDKTARM
jgi:hypothetical protein